MIRFVYYCGGCDNVAEAGHVRQQFESFSGRGYGFGAYRVIADPVMDAPDGWVAFDLIGATYCPGCAAEIWPESAAIVAALREALQDVKALAEFWIGREDTRGKSEEEYRMWVVLGHQSTAMQKARAALKGEK